LNFWSLEIETLEASLQKKLFQDTAKVQARAAKEQEIREFCKALMLFQEEVFIECNTNRMNS
jgi:hypothetical protein